MTLARGALIAQLATTLPLAGLIWTIQLVHYPLFARVGSSAFPAYHADHTTMITWLVGPLMLIELGACAASLVAPHPSLPPRVAWFGISCVAIAWATTAFASVPAHEQLRSGFDPAIHARLVGTNWLRTLAWTARSMMLVVSVTRHLDTTGQATTRAGL